MKHLVAVVALCSTLSIAAFVVLVAADRQLGLALPYSIPVSFTAVSILAPALFAIANAMRLRRPLVISLPPAAPRERAGTAEGVVLLDFSQAGTLRGRAA